MVYPETQYVDLNYRVLAYCTVSCYKQIRNSMYAIKEKNGRSRDEFPQMFNSLIAISHQISPMFKIKCVKYGYIFIDKACT